MDATTIKIHKDTKSELDHLREYRNESYDEVIRKVVYIVKNCKTKLSREALASIDKARKRMRKGQFVTEAEAKHRLGL